MEKLYKWLGVGKSNKNLNRHRYVFLLSHMRSYSTLLGHILGNHPEIAGYIEHHQSYIRDYQLAKLRYKLHLLHGTTALPNYLFDKILHNDYHLNPDYLKHTNVFPIIVLRKPESTIKSIINMGQKHVQSIRWYRNPQKVIKYYLKRLKRIETYGEVAGERALFFEADELITHPDSVLQALCEHLQLQSPLAKEYEKFNFTGTTALGDPSENIKSGKIISKKTDYAHIEVSPALMDKAKRKYEQTVANIRGNCKTIKIGKAVVSS